MEEIKYTNNVMKNVWIKEIKVLGKTLTPIY